MRFVYHTYKYFIINALVREVLYFTRRGAVHLWIANFFWSCPLTVVKTGPPYKCEKTSGPCPSDKTLGVLALLGSKTILLYHWKLVVHGRNYSPDCVAAEDEGKSGYFPCAVHLLVYKWNWHKNLSNLCIRGVLMCPQPQKMVRPGVEPWKICFWNSKVLKLPICILLLFSNVWVHGWT